MGKVASTAFLIALLVFFLVSHQISARLLPAYQHINQGSSVLLTPEEEDIANLMGMEECGESDEACTKRRMVAEAHLDYIYTQHNKPKDSP